MPPAVRSQACGALAGAPQAWECTAGAWGELGGRRHDGVVSVVAVNVIGSQVGAGWGKAPRVAVATVEGGTVTSWEEHEVRWDLAHDEGTEGSHHARIVRFLREHGVEVVVTGHMGPPMARMLTTMGIRAVTGVAGDAREIAAAVA